MDEGPIVLRHSAKSQKTSSEILIKRVALPYSPLLAVAYLIPTVVAEKTTP